ncbi:uncharacterized protein LOC132279027 [Cornus florida]|uniref:uncharacterized protein LOC132279027 n=1 Tax=Cornus florida TaxID=4283 RepID=UPI00289D24E0|nr:uncharacterized protein LOC132279027 [Cornus florida]
MAGYLPLKMKRKELDRVNDDFSDFSLSSPARKIRRLDTDLPPIMEEDEPEIPLVFQHSMPQTQHLSDSMEKVGGPVIEELPCEPVNEERAIVLFKPMNSPLMQSPSNFSVSVSPDLITGFRNQVVFWSKESNPIKTAEDEAAANGNTATSECLAVVPWNPSQFPPRQNEAPHAQASELMEAEEMEATTMDIEDDNIPTEQVQGNEFGGANVTEGLHHWPQQHCMIPQLPQNTSTPVVWFR